MRILLTLLLGLVTAAAILTGVAIFEAAKSAVHEIEGLICFLVATVALAGAAVGTAVDEARKAIVDELIRSNAIARLDRDDRKRPDPAEIAKVRAEMAADGRKAIDG
jgi:hypothetical protein